MNTDLSGIEFKIVQEKYPDELFKGEAIVVTNGNRTSLVLCCPNCGRSAGGSHVYDESTQTLSPSIICGNCGWHGYLRNGKYLNA